MVGWFGGANTRLLDAVIFGAGSGFLARAGPELNGGWVSRSTLGPRLEVALPSLCWLHCASQQPAMVSRQ